MICVTRHFVAGNAVVRQNQKDGANGFTTQRICQYQSTSIFFWKVNFDLG